MEKLKLLSLISLYSIIFTGCPDSVEEVECNAFNIIRNVDQLVLSDSLYTLYSSINSNISIVSAKMTQDTLTISVKYSGGGIKHDFTLLGMESIVPIMQPVYPLAIFHDSKGDPCTEDITEDLRFDISVLKIIKEYSPSVELQFIGSTIIRNYYLFSDTLYTPINDLIPTEIGNEWVYLRQVWLIENDSLVSTRYDTIKILDTINVIGYTWYRTNWNQILGLGSRFTTVTDTVYTLESDFGYYKNAKFINPSSDTISYYYSVSDYSIRNRIATRFTNSYHHNLGVFENCIEYIDDNSQQIILYPGIGVLYQSIIVLSPAKKYENILIDYTIN